VDLKERDSSPMLVREPSQNDVRTKRAIAPGSPETTHTSNRDRPATKSWLAIPTSSSWTRPTTYAGYHLACWCQRPVRPKPHGLLHGFSQLANRHVYTGTNINVGTLGCSYRIGLAFCQPHHMDTGFSQVIDVQELAHGIARSPDNHLVQICSFCLVKPAHQRGDHVAVFSMKIVTFTIEVGWHQRPEVGAVLTVERLTQFDTGNLGNRTGFVGWLQSP